jgi:hypothetical protein
MWRERRENRRREKRWREDGLKIPKEKALFIRSLGVKQ